MAASLDETSKTVYMALHRYGPIEWMQSEFCPLGRHQKNCSMCTSHPQVSLGEKKMEKNALHNDSRVDVVCYPGFCRADLFGEAKFIGSATRQKLEKMKIPTASVVRIMDEDQGERRMIVESLLDYDDPYEEEEDWYEY